MMSIAPLPRRIAWFAPWTWKRRWWMLAAAVGIVGVYVIIASAMFGRCEVCGEQATFVVTVVDFNSVAATHRYCDSHRHMAPTK
jgi:hypothetical protein